jgi:hypothetical protein
MLKNVSYPAHVLHGIQPLRRKTPGLETLRVFGLDTETNQGKAISLQICGPDDSLFCYTDDARIFFDFWFWIYPRLRSHGVNLCYVHNLSFDLRVLFKLFHRQMYEGFSEISFTISRGVPSPVEVNMLYGKINKATLRSRAFRLDIHDSRAFTLASLAGSLKMFGIDATKLNPPEELGYLDFAELSKDDPRRVQFEAYAPNDSLAERKLGTRIIDFHKEYDVSPAISLPSYAAKVFRRHFLRPSEEIPFPPLEVAKASELSFHGGKNGYYANGPRVFEDLYEIDINSAYPAAMASFPGLTQGHYSEVHHYEPGYLGVYSLSGFVDDARYPIIFSHDFKKVAGRFDDLWTTGYETELALRPDSGVRVAKIRGYLWEPDRGTANPFAAFVDHFYSRKERTAKSDPYYHFYKITLNALFGKTIAASEKKSFEEESLREKLKASCDDLPEGLRIDERWDPVLGKAIAVSKQWRAGALYNPFIATQITGFARRRLWELETKYHAVHSATDSIKTYSSVEPATGLGGLKIECHGRCYIFRNKLYLHFARNYEKCDHSSRPITYPERMFERGDGGKIRYVRHPLSGQQIRDIDGQHLCKFALHGYKGPLWKLFERRRDLLRLGKMDYEHVHVIGLREGMRRNLTPCNFVLREETLDLTGTSAHAQAETDAMDLREEA